MLRENYLSRTASPIQESHAFFIATTAKDATRAISRKERGEQISRTSGFLSAAAAPPINFAIPKLPKRCP